MASKIKVTAQKRTPGDGATWLVVEVDGVYVGYVGKFHGNEPWQAFERHNGHTPARRLRFFYGKDGKQQAIDEVVANAASLAS